MGRRRRHTIKVTKCVAAGDGGAVGHRNPAADGACGLDDRRCAQSTIGSRDRRNNRCPTRTSFSPPSHCSQDRRRWVTIGPSTDSFREEWKKKKKNTHFLKVLFIIIIIVIIFYSFILQNKEKKKSSTLYNGPTLFFFHSNHSRAKSAYFADNCQVALSLCFLSHTDTTRRKEKECLKLTRSSSPSFCVNKKRDLPSQFNNFKCN